MVSDGEEYSISYVFANPVHQFLHHLLANTCSRQNQT